MTRHRPGVSGRLLCFDAREAGAGRRTLRRPGKAVGTGADPGRLRRPSARERGGSARRRRRERTDNGVPGTENNNKAFAFVSRAPAAASGSRAAGGARHAARPGLRTAQVGPRAGSAYLARLLPVPAGPGCEVQSRGRDGRGGEEGGPERSRPPAPAREAPEGRRPADPASGARPCPSGRPPLPRGRECLWGRSLGTRMGGVRSAPTPSACIPPRHLALDRGPPRGRPEPRPGSRRLLDRNPVPALPRLGFAQAKQEMRCSRCTFLLRNWSAGVFLIFCARLPPQLGSRGWSVGSFPLFPDVGNLRLLGAEGVGGEGKAAQLVPRTDYSHTLACSSPPSRPLNSKGNFNSGFCAPTSSALPTFLAPRRGQGFPCRVVSSTKQTVLSAACPL